MAKSIDSRKPHPIKRELRAYGLTDAMIAAYLKLGPKYAGQMLNGHTIMPYKAEWKLQKLLDRLQNPVFADTEATTETAT